MLIQDVGALVFALSLQLWHFATVSAMSMHASWSLSQFCFAAGVLDLCSLYAVLVLFFVKRTTAVLVARPTTSLMARILGNVTLVGVKHCISPKKALGFLEFLGNVLLTFKEFLSRHVCAYVSFEAGRHLDSCA